MFQKARSRPARDALNKAGGIMSSSPELMDTVQMFSNGGGIKKAIPSLAQRNILKDQSRRQNNQIRIPGGEFEQQERLMEPSIYPSFYDTLGLGFDPSVRENAEKGAEQAKQESIITGSQAVGRFPAIAPDGTRIGYPIFDNGELKGYTELKPTENQKTRGMALGENFPTESDAFGGPTYDFDFFPSKYPSDRYKDPATIRQKLNITGNITGQRSGSEYQTPVIDISKDKNAQALLEYNREMANESGIGGLEQGLSFRPGVKVRSMGPLYDDPEGMGALSEGQTGQLQNLAAENQTALLEGQSEEMNAELEAARIASEIRNQEDKTELETAREASFEDARQGMSAAEARRINEDAATTGEESSIGPDGLMTEGLGREEPTADVDKNQVSDATRSGENIANSVETGNKDALTSQLKDLMAQFTSNAPKYEGLDKGLALMKIGAAMSSGTSPYALVNISKALSSGADMFIKDKASKDAFNRQVGLAALKYGMSKQATEEAQLRSDMRNFDLYVVGEGGFTDPRPGKNNRFIPKGGHVELSMADRMKYGDKMESLASVKSLKDYAAIFASKIDPAKAAGVEGQQTLARGFINQAEDATRAIGIFDQVKKLVNDPETAPFARGVKGFVAKTADKAAVFFGVEVDKKYSTQKEIEVTALAALGDIVSVAIGNTQSANSISDKDVLNQIIVPFFGGLVEKDSDGKFSINLNNKEIVNSQIDTAISLLLARQRQAVQGFDEISGNLARVPRVAGYKGTGSDFLLDSQERRSVFDVGPGGFTQSNMPVFDLGYDDEGIVTSMTLSKKKKT
tara:strand:+ start:3208 stop:5613 length:2406 start_codon:yes stop_codon:yes gene_type:complete